MTRSILRNSILVAVLLYGFTTLPWSAQKVDHAIRASPVVTARSTYLPG